MEIYLFSKQVRQRGFSLIEVVVALTVFSIGMCALAALTAQTVTGTERARYMGLATTLASEKLEDLNKWTSAACQVTGGGSLATDTTVACSGSSYNYYDDVDLSNTTGQVSETVTTVSGGTTTYKGVVHLATGEVDSPSTAAPPTGAGSGAFAFHRRWLVETGPAVNGVTLTGSRRVTVLVTLSNQIIKPAVSFQMSLIRP
jgi:prepilin-type N-terminal cleavage/methylation domain-containing protein